MRKVFCFIFVFCFSVSVFAHDSIMSGEKNLKVLTTKWFDVIYPEGSERSALILFENVDRIYEEVGEMYGFLPRERMPVVLTSVVQQENAYWSPAPYNHIAIYDTYVIEDLDVFSENLLSTFRHEVTHAFSYNLKNDFWHALSFFGDILNPGYLFITQGWAEGATVSSESAGGEGRLNNGFTLQMIRQAKIENQFPAYTDVQGASDKYPMNSFYYFNGAFDAWLQKTYGMDKYALFWYKCVNFQTIMPTLTFKKVFGIKIKDAWKLFKADIAVPDIPSNPIENVGVQDFFKSGDDGYSIDNDAGSLYTSLSPNEKGLVYLDSKCNTVYFVDKKELESGRKKPHKILAKDYIQSVSSSRDGNYLVVDYYSYLENNVKKKSAVYDVAKKHFTMEENGLFSDSIIQKDEKYYLVGAKYKNQEYSIYVKEICSKTDSSKAVFENTIALPVFEQAGNFVDVGTAFDAGSFAYIKKAGLKQTICVRNLEGDLLYEYELPESDMYIRYLSVDVSGNKLLFSWVNNESLPRLGTLSLKNGIFMLQNCDLSGGVYYPVSVTDEIVVYEGEFFRQNRMFTAKLDFLMDGSESQTVNPKIVNSVESGEAAVSAESKNSEYFDYDEVLKKISLQNPKKYNPFKYYTQGIFLPVSLFTSVSHSNKKSSDNMLPLGLTWISGNPWSGGLLIATAGYGLMTNSWGAEVTYQSSTGSGNGSLVFDVATEFDTKGWKQGRATVTVNRDFPFGNISQFSISESGNFFFGRNNAAYDVSEQFLKDPFGFITTFHPGLIETSAENYLYAANTFSVKYTNLRKTGSGKYEKGGISITADFTNGYLAESTFWSYQNVIGNLGFRINSYIPKLIPIKCIDRFVYNLPLRLAVDFLPYTSSSSIKLARPATKPSLVSADSEMILFAFDLQKSVPFIPVLFVNNLQISAVYYGAYFLPDSYSNMNWNFTKLDKIFLELPERVFSYSQWTGLRIAAGLTPNFACLANRTFKMDYFFEFGINATVTGSGTHVAPSITFGYTSSF